MMDPWWRSLVAAVVVGVLFGCTAGAKKIESSPGGVKASGVAVAGGRRRMRCRQHTLVPPQSIKWLNFPLAGPGVKAAVVAGDLDKPGPFVAPHQEPGGRQGAPALASRRRALTDPLRGRSRSGWATSSTRRSSTALPQGSYALLPREMHHFAQSKTATVVQVHGMGPFQINFVNPADDPRKKTDDALSRARARSH